MHVLVTCIDCLKGWDSLTKLEKVTEIKRPQHTLSGGLGRELEGSWKGAGRELTRARLKAMIRAYWWW